jgi:hypothetical protein
MVDAQEQSAWVLQLEVPGWMLGAPIKKPRIGGAFWFSSWTTLGRRLRGAG